MSDPNFHITTPRLYIHYFIPTNPSHVDFLFKAYTSSKNIAANQNRSTEIHDHQSAKNDLESNIQNLQTTGYGRYIVSLRLSSSSPTSSSSCSPPFSTISSILTPVGRLSMKFRPHPKAPKAPDVGFNFAPEHTGKGYATEAVQALLKYFEEEKGVTDVLGFCHEENERSKAMFRRLGWVDCGLREIYGINGKENEALFPLTWVRPGMKGPEEYGA